MARKKGDSGIQSSAGLMRYFDSEAEKGYKVSPRGVIGLGIALSVIVIILQVFIPV